MPPSAPRTPVLPLPQVVRVASRNSTMACWQTDLVVRHLRQAHPDRTFEVSTLASHGDLHAGPLSTIGGKGAFVKKLDALLLAGEAELTVSCAKDLPSAHDRVPGLAFGAVLPRGDTRDALVLAAGHPPMPLGALPQGARIGTSAPRRAAQLREQYPQLIPVPVRGNCDSRISALDGGTSGVTGLLVAFAGLERIGQAHRASQLLDPLVWLPASGAGTIVVEHRDGDLEMAKLLAPLNDRASEAALRAERGALTTLGGNCLTAASVHATTRDDALLVRGAVFAADGGRTLHATATGPAAQAESVGAQVGQQLLAQGAAALLGCGATS